MKKYLLILLLFTGCTVEPPVAMFEYQETTNGEVIFTNKSSATTSQTWDFGDGSSSAEFSPKHKFTDNKTYVVTLKSVGKGGENTTTKNVDVTSVLPVSDFDGTILANGGVKLLNKSVRGFNYEWSFGDATFSTEINPTKYYKQNGNYTISLKTCNKGGCDTKTKLIAVNNIATTGQVIFFLSQDLGKVDVTVGGQYQGAISVHYTSGEPTCGSNGNVTVTLPQGTYPFTAKSQLGILSWSET